MGPFHFLCRHADVVRQFTDFAEAGGGFFDCEPRDAVLLAKAVALASALACSPGRVVVDFD